MRIVIIGGGAAGISSLRNLLNFNSNSTSQNPSTTTSCSISNDSSKDGLNDDINDRSNLGLKSQGNCSANEKDLGADLRFEEEEKKTKSEFQVVLYEKMESIGGVWIYREDQNEDNLYNEPEQGEVNGRMFKYLHTNLPSSIMAFPEFKFPPSTSQFPTKDDIANYLDSYCHHFNLYPYIHLQHIVKHLSFESEKNQWKVVVNSLIENIEKIEYFDAVIIANGHYNKPYIPTIKGLENCNNNSSKIKLIHSHSYREPTPYKNKKIIVVGEGSSGSDIVREVSTVAKEIYHSVKNLDIAKEDNPSNVILVKPIKEITNEGLVIFEDETTFSPDIIIFATGFLYDFPFLDLNHIQITDGKRVDYLYKQIFYIPNPSLAFVGLPWKVIPFPLYSLQSQWITKVFSKEFNLPSKEEMEKDTQEFYKNMENQKILRHYTHRLGLEQFNYFDELCDYLNIPHLEPFRKELYQKAKELRKKSLGY